MSNAEVHRPGVRAARAHDEPASREDPEPIHPALRQLGDRLRRRGVRWCRLDSTALPGVDGGQLRAVVEPTDLDRAEHAVVVVGGIAGSGGRHTGRRTWLLRDPTSGTTVTLRVTTHLARDLGEDVSRRIVCGVLLNRSDECIPTIADTERFWLALLRALRQPRPAQEDVARFRDAMRRTPVASSPLAEVVTPLLGGHLTVPALLALLDHGGHLPRLRKPVLRPARRALARSVWHGPNHPSEDLSLTVAVVPRGAGLTSVLADPPLWPLPIIPVTPGGGWSDRPANPTSLLLYALWLRWRCRRGRTGDRNGALVLLDGHPAELLADDDGRQDPTSRALRWAASLLSPSVDAVAVVEDGSEVGSGGRPSIGWVQGPDRASIQGSPHGRTDGVVLRLPAGESPAARRARLGRGLWAVLGWRLASGDLPHSLRPPSGSERTGDATRPGGAGHVSLLPVPSARSVVGGLAEPPTGGDEEPGKRHLRDRWTASNT